MEAAKSRLQIMIGKRLFSVKYEEEKSKEILPELSAVLNFREEKLLLVSEIPKEVAAIIENRMPFHLVVDNQFNCIVNRKIEAVKETVRYVKKKYATSEEEEKINSEKKLKPTQGALKKDYDTPRIDFGGEYVYHSLLEDHGLATAESDCFTLQNTPSEKSNLKMTLKEPKISKKTFELDPNQLEGIRTALKSPISLIKGPPGTGKTHTATILAMILNNQILKSEDVGNKKLLICAQSNTGVDNLANKLSEYGLNVTKITSLKQMDNPKNLKSYDFCKKLRKKVQEKSFSNLSSVELFGELKNCLYKVKTGERLKSDENRLLYYHEEILDETQVICCTLTMITSQFLSRFEFPFIIVDEASQATEPEALIAFNEHPQKLIMFGDEKQLCPTVISQDAKLQGLSYSLFARLISNKLPDVKVHMLTTQYRMPARLAEFSSNKFYESKLKSHKPTPSRDFDWMLKGFVAPDKRTPIALFNVQTPERFVGTAIVNEGEAQELVAAIKQMLARKVRPEQIGVIAYYALQVDYIKDLLFYEKITGVEVNSVDGFQGRDKDIIMISTVRSNGKGAVGFSNDHQRFNVAVTRAKEWILIFSNKQTMKKAPIWNEYFRHYSL